MKVDNYYLATFFSCLGAIAMGTALGYSSPALPSMSEPDSGFPPITEDEASWIGSIVGIGALFGGLIGGSLMDRFGRKTVIVATAVPFVSGWMIIAFSGSFVLMIFGRIITGLCCGVLSLVVSVYISESSPPSVRGILSSCMMVGLFCGVLLVYVLGTFLNWFWLAIVVAIIPLLCSFSMVFMPESPRWLVKKELRTRALGALKFLDKSVDPEAEYRAIEKDILNQPQGKVSFRELIRPSVLKPFGLCISLFTFQQWCGFNGVLFFAGDIFKNSGYESISPSVSSIILGAAETVGTIIALFIIDRAGRKFLMMLSGIVLVISLTSLSIFSFMVDRQGQELQQKYGFITVISLGVYVTFFSMGYASIPWVITSEILPVRVRGTCSSIATIFCWGNGFVVAKTFTLMRTSMTVAGAYLFYDAVCIFACIAVFIFMPETKGKSLEQLGSLFSSNKITKLEQDQEDDDV